MPRWLSRLGVCPTLDFGTSPEFPVREFKPHVGLCADSTERDWDSLFPSLFPSPDCVLALSLCLKNKKIGAPGWLNGLSVPPRLRS